jgi:hypothetical protein
MANLLERMALAFRQAFDVQRYDTGIWIVAEISNMIVKRNVRLVANPDKAGPSHIEHPGLVPQRYPDIAAL